MRTNKCIVCGAEFMAKNVTKRRCKPCHQKAHNICSQRYYKQNRDVVLEKGRIAALSSYRKNKEHYLQYNREYKLKNKKALRAYSRNRYHTSPVIKIACNFRNLLYHALQRQLQRKTHSSQELCGCSWDELVKHIENQFIKGMDWDNRDQWHIDHIKPCAAFDLANPEQLKECFHYTNLQPIWAEDNLSKNSTYNGQRYYHKNG